MAQRVGRGKALLIHDRGTRRGWVVSSTLRPYFAPGKDPVPIVQEAGWAPGPVWTGIKSRPTGIRSPDRQPAVSPYNDWATWPTTQCNYSLLVHDKWYIWKRPSTLCRRRNYKINFLSVNTEQNFYIENSKFHSAAQFLTTLSHFIPSHLLSYTLLITNSYHNFVLYRAGSQ